MPSPQPLTTSCAETSDVANAIKVDVANVYTGRAEHPHRFAASVANARFLTVMFNSAATDISSITTFAYATD